MKDTQKHDFQNPKNIPPMKTIIIAICFLITILAPARSFADQPVSPKNLQGTILQTVNGTIMLRLLDDSSIVVLNIPEDFVVRDGTYISVRVDRNSLQPYRYTDTHGAQRTTDSVRAIDRPYVFSGQRRKLP